MCSLTYARIASSAEVRGCSWAIMGGEDLAQAGMQALHVTIESHIRAHADFRGYSYNFECPEARI